MRRTIEKLKAIWHIITDDEHAIYTITIDRNKMVRKRNCCIISDNASDLFLQNVVEFTDKYRKGILEENNNK